MASKRCVRTLTHIQRDRRRAGEERGMYAVDIEKPRNSHCYKWDILRQGAEVRHSSIGDACLQTAISKSLILSTRKEINKPTAPLETPISVEWLLKREGIMSGNMA